MHGIKNFKKKVGNMKFKYAILFVLVVLLIIVIVMKNHEKQSINDLNKVIVKNIVETKNINEDNQDKVIVIDPGHGVKVDMSMEPLAPGSNKKRVKAPIGAIGSYTKIPEYKIDWDVSIKLKKILEDKGFIVVMTKSDISENPGGIERAEIGNKANARLVVRIHADSFKDESVSGTTILVPEAISDDKKALSEESGRCANIILNTLENEVGVKAREVDLRKDLTAFNWSNVPTLLIEMGFLSNKKEDELLSTEEYQNKIAQAIGDGVEEAVKIEWNK